MCTSSDSVYLSTVEMANLMRYHDAVISNAVLDLLCKLHTLNPYKLLFICMHLNLTLKVPMNGFLTKNWSSDPFCFPKSPLLL